jgi:hypothetical protein
MTSRTSSKWAARPITRATSSRPSNSSPWSRPKILLGDIRTKLRTTAGSSLKKKYEGVKLAKIEFTDVTLQESLDGLRALSKNASGGQVVPNFIVTDPKIGTNKVSLTLTDMPLTTAIDYVAKVSGAKATYDQHAVLFTSAAGG